MAKHSQVFDMLIGLIGLSSFCLLTLLGLWAYSGSFLPSTSGASIGEALTIWLLWGAVIAIPVATAFLWVQALRRSRPSND